MNIADLESPYMTTGRDFRTGSRFEYLIGAYEKIPALFNDGTPAPITVERKGGFRSRREARKAGSARWQELESQS